MGWFLSTNFCRNIRRNLVVIWLMTVDVFHESFIRMRLPIVHEQKNIRVLLHQ